jgi:hypothetical protein
MSTPVQPWTARERQTGEAPTPRADAVLRNRLATPPGVAAWLRACERALVLARAAADAAAGEAATRGEPCNVLLTG